MVIFCVNYMPPVTMSVCTQDTFTFNADINECLMGTPNCAENATCTNTIGSYLCTCNEGYIGDGSVCEGKHYGI